MKIKQLVFTNLIILLCSCTLAAQDWRTTPSDCGENEARLDGILSTIQIQNDPNNVLIIIARPGDGEQSLELNRYRLHNAKEYLLIRTKLPVIPRNKIITAIGEQISGFGKVEFYFNGKMVEELFVKKNRTLCVDCCLNHQIKPFKKLGSLKRPKVRRTKS